MVATEGRTTLLCQIAIVDRAAAAIMPPCRNGRRWKGHSQDNRARNESLRQKYLGRKLRKKWSEYHRRNLVETEMHGSKFLAERGKSRDFD